MNQAVQNMLGTAFLQKMKSTGWRQWRWYPPSEEYRKLNLSLGCSGISVVKTLTWDVLKTLRSIYCWCQSWVYITLSDKKNVQSRLLHKTLTNTNHSPDDSETLCLSSVCEGIQILPLLIPCATIYNQYQAEHLTVQQYKPCKSWPQHHCATSTYSNLHMNHQVQNANVRNKFDRIWPRRGQRSNSVVVNESGQAQREYFLEVWNFCEL